jgi:hypothetical protein
LAGRLVQKDSPAVQWSTRLRAHLPAQVTLQRQPWALELIAALARQGERLRIGSQGERLLTRPVSGSAGFRRRNWRAVSQVRVLLAGVVVGAARW